MHTRSTHAVRCARTASGTALLLILTALSACLAPSHAPVKTVPAAPDVPYESIHDSIALGQPEDALQKYEQALAASPQSSATRVLHARLLMLAGKLAEARQEFTLVLADEPRNTDALYNLSMVAALQDSGEEQESLLSKVVEIDPRHADALAALGRRKLDRRETDAAASLFDRALAVDPANVAALLGSGAVAAGAKDWGAAVGFFTRAVVAQPDYPFSYIDRARCRAEQGDAGGALQDLTRAISLDPDYPWTYIDRGRLYLLQSHRAEAIADFSMTIRLDPTQFEAFVLRASALSEQGDVDGAIADWERVVSLKPEYGYAYAPLAALYWTRADWTKARAAFLHSYDFQDDKHSLALCAALCALRAGKPADAAGILEPVLSHAAGDSWQRDAARYIVERGTAGSFLARIDRERDKGRKSRMLFYVAIVSLVDGHNRAAVTYLTQIDGQGDPHAGETELARIELARQKAASPQ
jgi:tetratricopeptide (TPR) repeat protein